MWQVEFGAHQVILGRSAESLQELPLHLRNSNVLQMTVAQSKGLEFDDVFLWDFFNGSQAVWRPLNNYVAHLQEVQETHGHEKLPAGTPLFKVCEVLIIGTDALPSMCLHQQSMVLCPVSGLLHQAMSGPYNMMQQAAPQQV